MKKIITKYGNIFLSIYLILNVLCVNIGCCLNRYEIINLKGYSKWLIYLFITNSIITIIMFIYNIFKKKKIKFKLIDILFILMIVFSIISFIFAIDKKMALYGTIGRYEGLFSILYYLTLFYLSTYVKPKYKKFVVASILLGGIVEAVYLMFQYSEFDRVFDIKIIRAYFVRNRYNFIAFCPSGFISNFNFFGTYMILCLSYAIGLFMDNKYNVLGVDITLMIIILMAGLLMCNTLSALVGLIVVLLYLLIYAIKEKKIVKYICLIVILSLTTFTVHKLDKTTLIKDLLQTVGETKEIAKGNVDDSFGTGRMFIWKNTIKIVPKYITHGAGIDNFRVAFDGDALKDEYFIYDKAHNEYLQILITEGIFALISYLMLYGIITIKGIKNSFSNKRVYLVLPVIGYLVQAFFNISVIEVAPLFFISLGLCADRESMKNIFDNENK